jgi:CHRD domain-containing protein
VKKFVLVVSATALGLALVTAGGAAARSQAATIRITAAMTAANETPTPKGDVSGARGTFTATLTQSATGAVMTWRLEFSNLSGNAIAAHIHVAARGVAGPVRVPLCAPCTSGMTGTANVDATVLDAIQNDRAYVNVHTPTNPAGEIRDQVSEVASIKTALRAAQERPKPKGKVRRAQGTFTATVTKSGTSAVIAWRLTFSKLTGKAVAAHIHSGARGKAGPVIVPLCAPCKNGARGKATVGASVLSVLESGRGYVNIHTRKNAAGEVRGQIAAVPLTLG